MESLVSIWRSSTRCLQSFLWELLDPFKEKVLDDPFDEKVLDMTETKVDAVLNFARNVFVDTALKVSQLITFLNI